MLRTISIAGFGPHHATTLELDPKGITELEGPSQAGKSTAVDAVCWALWGVTASGKRLPAELIRDGAEGCGVSLTLGSGTTFERTLTRTGTTTRKKNGETYANAAAWTEALGPLGKNTDLLRVILAPRAWCDLAEGAGGGRPLRDLLATILPAGGLREIVVDLAGADLHTGDSLSVEDTYARRTEANRVRDEAAGRLQAATEEIERAPTEAPPVPETAAAEDVIRAARAWALWAPVEAWRAKRAELGDRPEDGDRQKALTAARTKRDKAKKIADGLGRPSCPSPEPERAQVAALERELAALQGSTTCPTCGQVVADHGQHVFAAEKRLTEARATLDRAQAQYDRSEADRIAKLDKADAAWTAAERELHIAAEAPDAAAEWDRRLVALGTAPSEVPHPPGPRPSEREVLEAKATLDRARVALGEAKQHAAQVDAAKKRHAAAVGAWDLATAEAERLDRLVEVLRRAPSILAARQVEKLGDLGPVTVRLPETGPAVEVLVDGRPYWTASRGRLVVADLWFRAALRRAVGLAWLPLFVDDVNAWSGEWPALPGPQVRLRTAAVDGLVVVGARRAA